MPFDQTRSLPIRDTSANSTAAVGDPPRAGHRGEAQILREHALWYRELMQRAGNPTIWQSRLRLAEELTTEADRLEREYLDHSPASPVVRAETRALDPRTRILLEAPILPTLLRLAWPNIAVMLV